MHIHRTKVNYQLLWILILIFFVPFSSSGQEMQECDSQLTNQIFDALAKGTRRDTMAANNTAISKYPNQRIYLLQIGKNAANEALSSNSVKIYLTNKAVVTGSLPCLFAVSANHIRIQEVHLRTREGRPFQTYSVVDNSIQPGLRVVHLSIPPDPIPPNVHYVFKTLSPETVYVKLPPQILIKHDTCYVKLSSRKSLKLSSGLIALGSLSWFGCEFFRTKKNFEKYETAREITEVIRLRGEVQKSRTRRNIAGALFLASGVTFFLVKAEHKIDPDCKKHGASDSNKKFRFRFEPRLATNEVQLALNLNF